MKIPRPQSFVMPAMVSRTALIGILLIPSYSLAQGHDRHEPAPRPKPSSEEKPEHKHDHGSHHGHHHHTGEHAHSRTDSAISGVVDSVVDPLAGGLTLHEVLELAMANNLRLQARHYDIDIAEAEVKNVTRIPNPSLGGALKMGLKGIGQGFEIGLAQSVIGLFHRPAQKKVAQSEVRQAKLRYDIEVYQVLGETEKAFIQLQAAVARNRVYRQTAEAHLLAVEMAELQHEAGNIPALELSSRKLEHSEALLRLVDNQFLEAELRDKLARLIGVWDGGDTLVIARNLTVPVDDQWDVAELQKLALQQLPDIQLVQEELAEIAASAGLSKRTSLIPQLVIGATYNKEIGNAGRAIEPSVQFEIPVFDRGQAKTQKYEKSLKQAQIRYVEAGQRAAANVRRALARTHEMKKKADLIQTSVLPLRRQATQESQLLYNGMYIGVYDLLKAKQDELAGELLYINTLEEYWTARAQLIQYVGGATGVNVKRVNSLESHHHE